MSFSGTLENLYKQGIRPVISDLGFDCLRADEDSQFKRITIEIERLIGEASFVVADLTENKQNCLYELGYAHGLGKPVILIARKGTDLDFDVSQFPCISYKSERDLRQKLSKRIKQAVLRTRGYNRNDDHHHGRFGGSALVNGRLLTARVLDTYRDDKGNDLCDIRIAVIPLPGKPPVQGKVHFFVHRTFKGNHRKTAQDGFAALELKAAYGAFTVGAELEDKGKKTRLELDLATIPGAPFTFYPSEYRLSRPGMARRTAGFGGKSPTKA